MFASHTSEGDRTLLFHWDKIENEFGGENRYNHPGDSVECGHRNEEYFFPLFVQNVAEDNKYPKVDRKRMKVFSFYYTWRFVLSIVHWSLPIAWKMSEIVSKWRWLVTCPKKSSKSKDIRCPLVAKPVVKIAENPISPRSHLLVCEKVEDCIWSILMCWYEGFSTRHKIVSKNRQESLWGHKSNDIIFPKCDNNEYWKWSYWKEVVPLILAYMEPLRFYDFN